MIDLGGEERDRSIVFHFDGAPRRVEPGELRDDSLVEELLDAIDACRQVVVGRWENVVDLDSAAQDVMVGLIEHSGEKFRVQVDTTPESLDPLQATLHFQFDHENLAVLARWRRLAVQIAAALHGGAAEAAAGRIREAFLDREIREPPLPQVLQSEIRHASDRFSVLGRLSPTSAARAYLNEINAILNDGADDGGDAEHAEGDGVGEVNLRFFRDEFYHWHGTNWVRIPDGQMKPRVVRFLQSQNTTVNITTGFSQSVMTNLQGMTLLDRWDTDLPFLITDENPLQVERRRLLSLQNGMIDVDEALRTGQLPALMPHSRAYFNLVALPFEYNPAAECPLWVETIEGIFPRRDAQDHRTEIIQEFMGYTLMVGDATFEKFLVATGNGDNGKSTILRIWMQLLGPENVSAVGLEGLASEFCLYEMFGKAANICTEMPRLDKVHEGRLKMLVSCEPTQVNRKHKPPVTMVPTAKLIFSTNELPEFSDRSDGLWRRLIVVPFQRQFRGTERDETRTARLAQELPGILNWALRGVIRLYQQRGFSNCSICQQVVHQHRRDSDPAQQFFDDRVVLEPDAMAFKEAIYTSYVLYCRSNNRIPRNNIAFGRQVMSLPGLGEHREGTGARRRYYTGIRLQSPTFGDLATPNHLPPAHPLRNGRPLLPSETSGNVQDSAPNPGRG